MARPARDLNFTPEEASSVNLMALHEAIRWRRRWRGGAVEDLTWRGSPRISPGEARVFCNRCAVHTNLFRETIYHFMESRECFDSMIFSFLNIFSASSQCAGTVDKTSLSVDMFMMNTPVTKFLYITSRHRFSLHYTLKS